MQSGTSHHPNPGAAAPPQACKPATHRQAPRRGGTGSRASLTMLPTWSTEEPFAGFMPSLLRQALRAALG